MIILFYLSIIWLAIEFWFIYRNKANQSFRRAKIALFSWFTVNILSFLIETKNEYAADQIFPFDSDSLANYDYAEIFIYILLPVLIWYFFKPNTIILNPINELNNLTQAEITKKSSNDFSTLLISLKIFLLKVTKYIIIPLCLIILTYYIYEQNRKNEIEKKEQIRIKDAKNERYNYRTINLSLYLWKEIKLKTVFDNKLKFAINILFEKYDKSREKYVLGKINQINLILKDSSGFNILSLNIPTSSMIKSEDSYGIITGYQYQSEYNGISLSDYERISDWDLTYSINPSIELVESEIITEFVGKTLSEAKFEIVAKGFNIGKIVNEEKIIDNELDEAFISSQFPKANAKAPIGGFIDLTVSKINPLSVQNETTDNEGSDINNNPNPDPNTTGYFTIGSTKSKVISIQGTPDKIRKYGSTEYFEYGYNEVKLENDLVVDYNNSSSSIKLKIRLLPKTVSNKMFYTIGSTRDEVLSIQGTPDKIRKYGSTEYFEYGYNEVKLKNGLVVSYNNSSSSEKLKIKL